MREEEFDIVLLPETFDMEEDGLVTGSIYFKIGDRFFPEEKWNDFVIPIFVWWYEEISVILRSKKRVGDLLFMDGPFYLRILKNKNLFKLRCMERTQKKDIVIYESSVSVPVVIESVLRAGDLIIERCNKGEWNMQDLSDLLYYRSIIYLWTKGKGYR